MTNEDLQQIQTLVTNAGNTLVITHANPSIDTMASALAIYLALSKMGKNVTIAMESDPLVEVSNLVGIDKVTTSLSGGTGGDLLLTYQPYQLGDFENVKFNENPGAVGLSSDTFSLSITPRAGYVPNPSNFQFSFSGGAVKNYDLVITVEILEPTQAGKLYDEQMFSGAQIINIDNHDPNRDFGKFNLVEPEAASVSEIVTFFLRAINAQLDGDMANNLYQGIVSATQNFQSPKVAAATFEAAAICLRAKTNANKQSQQAQPMGNTPPQAQPMGNTQIPVQPMGNVQPTMGNTQAPTQPMGNVQQTVPQDWTQPKAYRGTSTV